jgi:hypothetical protein
MAIRATISVQRIQAQTANELVQAQTVYQSVVASEISVNPDSKNLMLFDSVPLSEVVFKVITKGLADSTAVTDLYASHFNKGTIAESVSVADTFAKVVTYNRTFSDSFTLDDLAQIDKDFYGNKGNIFAFTDIIGLTNNKNLTDSYTVSDVFTKVLTYSRSFTDSTTLSDSEYYSLAKSTSDPLTLSDSQLKGFTTQKTDSFTVADAADKSSGLAKTDSFSFADSSYFSASKETSDSVSLADSHYRALTKIIADAFTLDDSALINKNYYGNKGNVCTISDLIAFTLVYSRSYTDSFSFNDTTITELSKVINDVVTMTDSTLSVMDRGKEATDVLGFVELMASTVDKVLSDQATLSDNLSSLVGKGISETVSFNDSTVSEITKVVTDAFALDDSALVNKDYFGSKGNVCTVSDVISFAFIWNRTFAHSFSFSDEDSYLLGKNVQGAGEVVSIGDLVTLTTISGKVLNGAQLNRITLN